MTEALIADLARIKAVHVTSRQSVMRYKGSDKPLPEIARELGVNTVVEGSVLRAGSRVRVTAQLIEAATDRHLWADSFDRELEDVFALFSDVARSIAKEVQANLTPEEEAGLAETRPVNPDSYDAYLMGRYHVSKRTPEGLGRAIEYYQEAIRLEPGNALAHSGLGEAYAYLGVWGWASARDVMPPARAAAVQALEIDEDLSEAHLVLATIKFHFDWDWEGGRREFERAIDSKPGNAEAHATRGMYLGSLGRFEEAAAAAERALELDPLSVVCNDVMTWVLFFSRRFDEVPGQARKLLELSPTSPAGHWGLAFAYHLKGMYPESWAMQAKGCAAVGFQEVAEAIERGHEEAGYPGAMRGGAIALSERRRRHHFSAVWIAILFAFGEDKETAFQWLETGAEERDPFLVYARVAPYWDSLRSDPRFQDILRRLAIPSEGPAET
jgi:tetratricopeptide (TPR) repeat protein